MTRCNHIDSNGTIYEDEIQDQDMQNPLDILKESLRECSDVITINDVDKEISNGSGKVDSVSLLNVKIGAFDYYLYVGGMKFRNRGDRQNEIGLQISSPHQLKRINEFLGLNIICVGVYSNQTQFRTSELLFYFFNLHQWFLSQKNEVKIIGNTSASSSLFADHIQDSQNAISNGPHVRDNNGRIILSCKKDQLHTCISENLHTNFFITKSSVKLNYKTKGVDENIELSKPFLLLAGISGTGKTRFVREQADNLQETYCLTSVRPDWHEPSELLGYISRMNGPSQYITTDVIRFIAKAWRHLIDGGVSITTQNTEWHGKCLAVTGNSDELKAILPYWLCLDEMNLAPVEQYFADYLSVLETREWTWEGDAFTYMSDALLTKTTINLVDKRDQLREDLGFTGERYNVAWDLFCQYGMGIPFNLIVAGTVNMDETTHGFSRKVIDRALTFDFGKFFPNNFAKIFESDTTIRKLSYPVLSQAKISDLRGSADNDGQKTITFLSNVNAILDDTPFQLAYRALNELLLAVASQNPTTDLELQAVWDDFLMCKVLPRIEGDSDKLGLEESLLQRLSALLAIKFSIFWELPETDGNARPDLYREKKDSDDKMVRIECRSKAKLEWMQQRLVKSSFTSFWP
jgi:hypothetical protein